MPLVKIELAKGKEKSFLLQLMGTVMDSVQEGLKLPADDRNIRLIEHDPVFFTMKKPYSLLIEITLFSGRTLETKKRLYETLVNKLHRKMGISKEAAFIVLNEQPMDNWGVRGGVAASEIQLDFKVDI
jgi:phenylpyruvate tautomerase PptA (4-oxalocrotonate tautomerase family)